MDENSQEQNVLLVKEKSSDTIKVVSGIDKEGHPESIDAMQENEPQFLKINLQGNALDNFLSNFLRQYKDPTHFQFFKAPMDKINEVINIIREALNNPDAPTSKTALDTFKVESLPLDNKSSIDESRIDWTQLERIGISRETLVKTKSLDIMLNWHKSPTLIPITLKLEGITIRTDARLSFRETTDGKITLNIHALRKKPDLERPYFGLKFTDKDKQNLLSTGNLGRIANVEFKQGQTTPVFISLDKMTNELVAIHAYKFKIPDTIKGVTLNEVQKKELAEGKSLFIEGMTSKSGKEFSAHIQVNADKRGIEFRFDRELNQSNQFVQNSLSDNGGVRIPKTLLGVDLSEKQQTQLKENQTVYISGMKDKSGQEFNAYVRVNYEKGKLDFFKWNPDKAKVKDITSDSANTIQVAANNEGKTDETVKRIVEPVKKGQTQPAEKQIGKQKKKQNDEKSKKYRGLKM